MSWQEELAKELTAEKIEKVDFFLHGESYIYFKNGMQFVLNGRWRCKREYDENGKTMSKNWEFHVINGDEHVGLDNCELYQNEHSEYFQDKYKPFFLIVQPEIQDMVDSAVRKYFENLPADYKYKDRKIVYTDYVKGQNKQQDKAEEQGSQQISLKQLGEQTQTQSKNENNITSMHTESDSDKKLDMNSSSSSNGMGKQ